MEEITETPAGVADLLIPLEIGQTIDVPYLNPSQNCGIRIAAIRRGFAVRVKRNKLGGFTITKMSCEFSALGQRHNDNEDRDVLIRRAANSGRNYDEIAEEWAMSRQRVDQIVHSRDYKFSQAPVEERVRTLDEFIRPYVKAVISEHALCVICGAPSPGPGVATYICADCRPKFRAIRQVAAFIRAWKRTGDRHYLSMALVRIRKYQLTPEDMEWQ